MSTHFTPLKYNLRICLGHSHLCMNTTTFLSETVSPQNTYRVVLRIENKKLKHDFIIFTLNQVDLL